MSEPVAYINVEERRLQWAGPVKWDTPTIAKMDKIPLYTHPVKELTDEEIEGWIVAWAKDLYGTLYVEPTDHQRTMAIKMARAILRKAQEK